MKPGDKVWVVRQTYVQGDLTTLVEEHEAQPRTGDKRLVLKFPRNGNATNLDIRDGEIRSIRGLWVHREKTVAIGLYLADRVRDVQVCEADLADARAEMASAHALARDHGALPDAPPMQTATTIAAAENDDPDSSSPASAMAARNTYRGS